MTHRELIEFLRRHWLCVGATVSASGGPEAAALGFVVSDDFEFFFDTESTTRKAKNLRRDARAALVVGWDDMQTAQIEGVVDEPDGDELARLKKLYFARFPDGPTRESWPNILYLRLRPTWIRYSDFRGGERRIKEFAEEDLVVG